MRSPAVWMACCALGVGGCAIDKTGLGAPDSGPCVASIERCDGVDDDCDGTVDNGFDLETDRFNCGACGHVCPSDPGNGSSACVGGECAVTCDPGFADCDMDISDGCEAILSSPANCGDCDTTCADPTPFCQTDGTTYTCVGECDPRFTTCGSSCVDVSSDVSHCGSCENPCPMVAKSRATCVGGACGLMCDASFGDCDMNLATGCEQTLRSISHCGACDRACAFTHATAACPAGTCGIGACDVGFGDCDGSQANGCEQPLNTLADCGACGVACSPAGGMGDCSSGRCVLAGCGAGFADCDMNAANGCETPTTTLADCGGCGVACNPAHATGDCRSGACAIGMCDVGFADCAGGSANGCEADLGSNATCGSCTNACAATAPCVGGTCSTTTCGAGFADCDMNAANGCETPTTTRTDCGGCGVACNPAHATGDCSSGMCAIGACDPGFDDCDASAANGCETPLDTRTDCGGCGVACAAMDTCVSGSCVPPGMCPSGCGTCATTTCGTGGGRCSCTMSCPCTYTCSGACDLSCSGAGTTCNVTTTARDGGTVSCSGGATCTITETNPNEATTRCSGAGTTCDITCSGRSTDACRPRCTMGASCILRCVAGAPSDECSFGMCRPGMGGGAVNCGGGVWVCNRRCP